MKKRFFYFALVVLSGIIFIYSCSKGYNSPMPTGNGPAASVSIVNMAFSPDTLKIKAGTTVSWMNNDGMAHTVTSDVSLFNSGNMAVGVTYKYTFSAAGTYSYHCAIHPTMTGVVAVN
ncbi:MAG: cupredoxin family copper-binding protein [Bacteroidota bacterium]|nr:cupredoxin family copper-binding protein [Bacteroidota bacterium]